MIDEVYFKKKINKKNILKKNESDKNDFTNMLYTKKFLKKKYNLVFFVNITFFTKKRKFLDIINYNYWYNLIICFNIFFIYIYIYIYI